MTPDQINEAHELLQSRAELREVCAYIVSHPSCHGNLTVGKLETSERHIQGGFDLTIPQSIVRLAVDSIRRALDERLSALGVRSSDALRAPNAPPLAFIEAKAERDSGWPGMGEQAPKLEALTMTDRELADKIEILVGAFSTPVQPAWIDSAIELLNEAAIVLRGEQAPKPEQT